MKAFLNNLKNKILFSKKGLIILSVFVLCIVFVCYLFCTHRDENVYENYFSDTYGFSISISEKISELGYSVFESDNGIVSFQKDKHVLFEIHTYSLKEWESMAESDEVVLGINDKNVFTLFYDKASNISEDDIDIIINSFTAEGI